MKKIEAIFKPFKLEEVKGALADLGIEGMTVSEVKGFGRRNGRLELYRGTRYTVDFQPEMKLEVVVTNNVALEAAAAVARAVRCGENGDGKVFILPMEEVVRIRTAETGDRAV